MTDPTRRSDDPAVEDNLARLLSRSYRPEPADPAFAARVEGELLAEAAGLRAARRTRWIAAAAAVLGAAAVGATWRGTTPGHPEERVPAGAPGHVAEAVRDADDLGAGLLARDLPPPPDPVRAAPGVRITTSPRERRRLVLDDGSVLFVNGGSDVRIEAARRVRVAAGGVYVEVAPDAARPFTVATPVRDVTAVGTRFAVGVDGRAADVLVTHGAVAVSGSAELVRRGERMSVTADGKARVEREPRTAERLDWTRDLMEAAQSPLVPASAYAGGAIVTFDPSGQEARLSLRKFHVDVHIEDGFARTTIDQTYFNHATARTEGTFYFPLPPGASLSRLAMYVGGKRMEGGMTSRDRGREVYEEIRQTRRDPVLLEWIDGSTFKMRVFPLEPREEKRILLSYVERLPERAGAATYRFPTGHTLGETGEWTFAGRVVGGASAAWSSDTHDLASRSDGGDLVLSASAKAEALARDLVVRVAAAAGESPTRCAAFEQDGLRYLVVRHRPRIAAAPASPRRDWAFVVETSGGRDPVAARAQIEVVRALLAQAGSDDRFVLVAAGAAPRRFADAWLPADRAHAAAAVEFLERSHLVGGLDLGAAFDAVAETVALRGGSAAETVLVHVGTGVAVLGETDGAALAARVPGDARFVGVAVGRRAARTFLRAAAARTGGFWTQVQPEESAAFRALEIADAIDAPWITGLAAAAGDQRFHVFDDAVAAGGEIAAVVRLEAKAPLPERVVLSGTLRGAAWSETVRVADVSVGAGYLPREWARLEIERLLLDGAAEHKDTIIALSKAMYVISPYTSLIVLEDDAMYERFAVDRGRKDHWASYPAPDTIPVVREPVPSLRAPAAGGRSEDVDRVLATILVRIPRTRIQFGDADWVRTSWGGQVWTIADLRRTLAEHRRSSGVSRWDESVPGSASGVFTIAGGTWIDGTEFGLRGWDGDAKNIGWATFGRRYFGPRGEVPPDTREPSDPPPPPDGFFGPATPGQSLDGLSLRALGSKAAWGRPRGRTFPGGPGGGGGGGSPSTGAGAASGPAGSSGSPGGHRSVRDALRERLSSLGYLSGAFFEGGEDGDFRARTESVFDRWPTLTSRRRAPFSDFEDIDGDGDIEGLRSVRWDGVRFSTRDEPAPGNRKRAIASAADAASWSVLARTQHGRIVQALQYRRPQWNQNPDAERDLFSELPAFVVNDADVLSVLDAESAAPGDAVGGDVDAGARAVLDRARALPFERVRRVAARGERAFDVVADGAGRHRSERILRSGLREITTADGSRLVHVYPDVALGSSRAWSPHHDADLVAYVPWHVPAAEFLARGTDVRLAADGVVSVVARGGAAYRLDLEFAADGRLRERRIVAAEGGRVVAAERYLRTGGSAEVQRTDATGAWVRVATFDVAPAPAPDLSAGSPLLTLLPMPWRTEGAVVKARGLDGADRRDPERWSEDDALAIATARRRGGDVAEVLVRRFFARGDVRPGLVALLIDAGVRFDASQPSDLGGVRGFRLDPRTAEAGDIGLYLAQAALPEAPAATPAPVAGDSWAARRADLMALLRTVRGHWRQSNQSQAERETLVRRALDVAERQSGFEDRWIALCVAWNLGWPQDPRRVAALLVPLTEDPVGSYVARYERAVALAWSGDEALGKASDREFTQLYDETLDGGVLPRIDGNFASGMRSRDPAGFRAHFRRVAEKLTASGRRDLVPYLALQVQWSGDAPLAGALLATAVDGATDDDRTWVLLAAIEASMAQSMRAPQEYAHALTDAASPAASAPWVHRLAAAVHRSAGDDAAALDAEERALDLEFADLPDVVDLSVVRASYGEFLARIAHAAKGARALAATPPAGTVARIVRAADRWRTFEPDATEPCLLAALALRDLGRADLAWAYATTPLDRRPNEAAPWRDLARHLREVGDLGGADRAFAQAYRLEPTDGGLLWEHAETLRLAGRSLDARALYRRLAEGTWAPPYQQFQQMAAPYVR